MKNIQEVQHKAPALSLAGALECHPEPYKPIFYHIPEVTRSDNHDNHECKKIVTHCGIWKNHPVVT